MHSRANRRFLTRSRAITLSSTGHAPIFHASLIGEICEKKTFGNPLFLSLTREEHREFWRNRRVVYYFRNSSMAKATQVNLFSQVRSSIKCDSLIFLRLNQ